MGDFAILQNGYMAPPVEGQATCDRCQHHFSPDAGGIQTADKQAFCSTCTPLAFDEAADEIDMHIHGTYPKTRSQDVQLIIVKRAANIIRAVLDLHS